MFICRRHWVLTAISLLRLVGSASLPSGAELVAGAPLYKESLRLVEELGMEVEVMLDAVDRREQGLGLKEDGGEVDAREEFVGLFFFFFPMGQSTEPATFYLAVAAVVNSPKTQGENRKSEKRTNTSSSNII